MMFKNLGIGTKTTIFVSIILSAMITSAAIGIASFENIDHKTLLLEERNIPLNKHVSDLTESQMRQTIRYETAMKSALLGDWEQYEKAKQDFENQDKLAMDTFGSAIKLADDVLASDKSAETQELYTEIKADLIEARDAQIEFDHMIMERFEELENGDPKLVAAEETDKTHMIEAREKLSTLIHERFDKNIGAIETTSNDATIIQIIGTISAIAVGAVSILLIRKMIAPIRSIVDTMQKISEGDLTVQIMQSKSKDEIGMLNESFGKMVQRLKGTVTKIQSGAQEVASTSEELSASSEELTSSINEISSSVQNISQGSQKQAAKLSEANNNAVAVLGEDNSGAQKALEGMERINAVVETAISDIKNLGEESKKITTVVDVINKIADQTNLLALNAAVEAARAGEAGRGFAVVADEVRRLAEQSAGSTKEINTLVNSIQNAIEDTTQKIESSMNEAKSSREVVDKSLNALIDMSDSIKTVTSISQDNASATEETSAAVDEQTSATTSIASAATNLTELASKLQTITEEFKINDENIEQSQPPADKSDAEPKKINILQRVKGKA